MIACRGIMMIVLLSVCFAACEKKNKDQDNQDCGYIEAKLLRVDCDEVIFRLVTNEAIGDASWTDVTDGQVYQNVVRFRNTCLMAAKTEGYLRKTIYVKVAKINQPVLPTNCVECQAISRNPPQQWVDFMAISTTPCGPKFILD